MNRTKQRPVCDNIVNVYAKIQFGRGYDKAVDWKRIGSGIRNSDGSIDIEVNCWLTNMSALQILEHPKLSARRRIIDQESRIQSIFNDKGNRYPWHGGFVFFMPSV